MAPISRVALVVVAAGSGTRFGAPKQFAPLADRLLLAHSLAAFDGLDWIAERIVVLSADLAARDEWQSILGGLRQRVRVVEGGRERADSVRCGVRATSEDCDLVAVHDGARPFPPVGAMRRCVDMLVNDPNLGGAIVASPVVDTLKALAGDGITITHTINRATAARAETPQVCRRFALLDALDYPEAGRFTDEAQALEFVGLKTAVVLHKEYNIKVTTPADLLAAEAWLRRREK